MPRAFGALAIAAAAASFLTAGEPARAAPDSRCVREVDRYVHTLKPRPSRDQYRRAVAKCEPPADVKAALATLSGDGAAMTDKRCIAELKHAMAEQRIPPKRGPYEKAIDICRDSGDLAAAKRAVGAK